MRCVDTLRRILLYYVLVNLELRFSLDAMERKEASDVDVVVSSSGHVLHVVQKIRKVS